MFSQISMWVGVSVSAHTHPHRYLRNDERVVEPCLVFGFVFTCLVLSWRVVFSLVLCRYIYLREGGHQKVGDVIVYKPCIVK